ncbi:MAG TPA: hypothetical protein PKE55_02325 [Kiritimatiellia bacterium]|nr:hypothetical protein [Kiritimatiellia bacterium]
MKLLDDRIRPKVSLVHLGTILDKIEGQVGGNPDLVEHYRQFRRKYQPALVK